MEGVSSLRHGCVRLPIDLVVHEQRRVVERCGRGCVAVPVGVETRPSTATAATAMAAERASRRRRHPVHPAVFAAAHARGAGGMDQAARAREGGRRRQILQLQLRKHLLVRGVKRGHDGWHRPDPLRGAGARCRGGRGRRGELRGVDACGVGTGQVERGDGRERQGRGRGRRERHAIPAECRLWQWRQWGLQHGVGVCCSS